MALTSFGLTQAVDDPSRAPAPLGRVELLFIFGFWTLFGVLMAANRLYDPRGFGPGPGADIPPITHIATSFIEAYLWAGITVLAFWLASRLPIEAPHGVPRVFIHLGAGIIIVIAIGLVMRFVQHEVFDIPLPGRRGPGPRPDFGAAGGVGAELGRGGGPPFSGRGAGRGSRGPGADLILGVRRGRVLNDLIMYVGVLVAGIARDYFLKYHARREEAAQLQAETARLQAESAQLHAQLVNARLAALRTQINPHFLFNTLHAVSTLVERDPRGVRRMIARLSELMRYTLEGADEQEIPLEKELGYLDRYLEIMQVRFQESLDVDTQVGASVLDALVPTLILQPLVENAVKHGVSKVNRPGRIEISARRDGERLVLTVRDNGSGLAGGQMPSEEGIGLRNTRERLAQLYGDDHTFVLRPADGGGAIAEVTLPYHTRADLHASGERFDG
jgi:signal transduction histidine kinase